MCPGAARQPRPTHARKRARRLALQALYQWQVSRLDLNDIERQFGEDPDVGQFDADYFHELLHRVPDHLEAIDSLLAELLDRPVNEVDPVERALLRIAVYELKYHIEIPYKVVLNEAVSLAKTFGAVDSHKYVNSALDKAAKRLRSLELDAAPRAD